MTPDSVHSVSSNRENQRTAQPCVASFSWHDASVSLSAPAWLVEEISRFVALPSVTVTQVGAVVDIMVTPTRQISWRQGLGRCDCATDDDLVMSTMAVVSSHLLSETASLVLHAVAFIADGQALLFMGPEFVGKSSLACTAWRRGLPLVGDDWTVLADRDRVTSFPKPLKTRCPSSAAPDQKRHGTAGAVVCGQLMNQDHRCMYSRTLAGMAGYERVFPIGALFLIGRGTGRRTIVAPASRDRALTVVLEQTIDTRASALGVVKTLEQLTASGAVFECQIGERDFDRALSQMMDAHRRIPGHR